MNLNEIETSAPRKYRAVHKKTGESHIFTFDDIDIGYWGTEILIPTKNDATTEVSGILFKDCYPIDQFTGHVDKDGKEIYGGDVVKVRRNSDTLFVVTWHIEHATWDLRNSSGSYGFFEFDTDYLKVTVIGNIHNPDALPEEVRRMLDDR